LATSLFKLEIPKVDELIFRERREVKKRKERKRKKNTVLLIVFIKYLSG